MASPVLRVAKSAGFCYGVTRAVDAAFAEAEGSDRPLYTLGELIHNAEVVRRLEQSGVSCVKEAGALPDGATVLIRAHGVGRSVYETLEAKKARVVDATCPFVARIHEIVKRESGEGRTVVVVGDEAHPEVIGIVGWCPGRCFVAKNPEECADFRVPADTPLSVVAQTTLKGETWRLCVNTIKRHYTNVVVFDTICRATKVRQAEAAEIAQDCDAVVVIGDRTSSNTSKLVGICRDKCPKVLHVEDKEELAAAFRAGFFNGCGTIGLTAGASVPLRKIEEVKDHMSEELKDTNIGEESFAEMLEKSIKTLHTGERVTGIVTSVTPSEVHVDLGTKHAGFIPASEMTDDPNVKLEDSVKVDDKIEVIVVKVNDAEGTVLLSKKKVDSIRGWESIEAAVDDKIIYEGVVVEDNKGGVVVSVNGVRVFVPASQTGLPREAAMSELLKKKVKVRISEVNRQKRRVVGSIRAAAADERKQAAAAVWDGIEVGRKYDGVVKSLTDYGAFVDIGGVDGMVHLTELSWSRVKHPSEVVKPGDHITVYVIGFDPEKKKISLGYKDPSLNPWQQFTDKFEVGDIADVRIVKLMPFGAFAEVVPGVDGLIHISQLSDRRVARPAEVVEEGQIVRAKIIEVDNEHKKISLSIREAAQAGSDEEGEAEEEQE